MRYRSVGFSSFRSFPEIGPKWRVQFSHGSRLHSSRCHPAEVARLRQPASRVAPDQDHGVVTKTLCSLFAAHGDQTVGLFTTKVLRKSSVTPSPHAGDGACQIGLNLSLSFKETQERADCRGRLCASARFKFLCFSLDETANQGAIQNGPVQRTVRFKFFHQPPCVAYVVVSCERGDSTYID